jgi:hypothetical protein
MECLEKRELLSWPAAPFGIGEFAGTIYVNQLGDAMVSGRWIGSSGGFFGYDISFDDGGVLNIQTRGVAALLAFYEGDGQPTVVSKSGSLSNRAIGPEKSQLWIGVQAPDPRATGTYDVSIDGASHTVIRPMHPARTPSFFYVKTAITGANDSDFLVFTTTFAGSWTVWVVPERKLDATMNVFSRTGVPVGGSFTRPINKGGEGVTESWSGTTRRTRTTYYVRVDGRGESTGRYQVFARPTASATSKRR